MPGFMPGLNSDRPPTAVRNYVQSLSPSPRTRPRQAMDAITYYLYTNSLTALQYVISLVPGEFSEPYVVYTYRYFTHQWPHLAFLAAQGVSYPVGVMVCKQPPIANPARAKAA